MLVMLRRQSAYFGQGGICDPAPMLAAMPVQAQQPEEQRPLFAWCREWCDSRVVRDRAPSSGVFALGRHSPKSCPGKDQQNREHQGANKNQRQEHRRCSRLPRIHFEIRY
jgi:hypothetical protein